MGYFFLLPCLRRSVSKQYGGLRTPEPASGPAPSVNSGTPAPSSARELRPETSEL